MSPDRPNEVLMSADLLPEYVALHTGKEYDITGIPTKISADSPLDLCQTQLSQPGQFQSASILHFLCRVKLLIQ
jgi:hypothetical protein